MSYTGTKAQSGNQATVSIGSGTSLSGATYTAIGGGGEVNQSGTINKTDDATNVQATAEEFIPTILSPGMFQGTLNRISSDAGQQAVLTAFTAAPPHNVPWQVALAPNAAIGQTSQGD